MTEVGPPQRCLVFAVLASDAGRLVLRETLIDRVWGQTPPHGAWRTVQTHIASLRGLLRRADAPGPMAPTLGRRRGGYLLDIDPDLVDVHRFRRLTERAGRGGRLTRDELAAWREAVALWRGEPLAALAGDWAARTREAWYSEYRDAVLGWAYAEIMTADPAVTLGPLSSLIDRYPLVEALPAMLMRVLYTLGRRIDALDCYLAARQRLDAELAERPGAELQAVYQAILRHDVALPPPVAGLHAGLAVPAQLPADLRGFVGRAPQLARLDAIADTVGVDDAAVVISAIVGTAGVGKTALAVHWAHHAARRFPDGQLYIDLRGFDPAGAALDPAHAIRGFLDALAIPPERIPASHDAQVALYRTQLADKRMLVVLDNARDTEQVRPLLPGAPGCLVLVTSRNELTSLVATTGAHPLALDLLTAAEACDLLTRRIGSHRVAAEPDAVEALVARCTRLPLALATVAARAAIHPQLSLGSLAAALADTRTRLDALVGNDSTIDLRTVFHWSYATLRPAAARLFRLFGLHPGPDLSIAAAASLASLPPTGRMLDHYLHSAYCAGRVLSPPREPITLNPLQPGTSPEQVTDHQQALAWFTTEHAVLLAAIDHAATAGFDTHAWQLAWALHDYLERRGHWHDLASTQQVAVAAARLADLPTQAQAHRLMARAYRMLGRYDDAHVELGRALDKYEQCDHRLGSANTHHTFALALAAPLPPTTTSVRSAGRSAATSRRSRCTARSVPATARRPLSSTSATPATRVVTRQEPAPPGKRRTPSSMNSTTPTPSACKSSCAGSSAGPPVRWFARLGRPGGKRRDAPIRGGRSSERFDR